MTSLSLSLEADVNWNMVRGDRSVVCIPNYRIYG